LDRNRIIPLDAEELRGGQALWSEATLMGVQSVLLTMTDTQSVVSVPDAIAHAVHLPYLRALVAVQQAPGGMAGATEVDCPVRGCRKKVKVDALRHHVAVHFARDSLGITAGCWKWCGFCGGEDTCTTVLRMGSNSSTVVINSNCAYAPKGKASTGSIDNDCKLKFKSASKFGSTTSNVPLPCVLCKQEQEPEADIGGPRAGRTAGGLFERLYDGKTFVWKLAMAEHLNQQHAGQTLPVGGRGADWPKLYCVDEEVQALKGMHL
jgi:hypothetical protein